MPINTLDISSRILAGLWMFLENLSFILQTGVILACSGEEGNFELSADSAKLEYEILTNITSIIRSLHVSKKICIFGFRGF